MKRLIIPLICVPCLTFADFLSWTGNSDQNLSNALNWNPAIPPSGNDLFFASGGFSDQLVLAVSLTAQSMNFSQQNWRLECDGDLMVLGPLSAYSEADFSVSGTLTLNQVSSLFQLNTSIGSVVNLNSGSSLELQASSAILGSIQEVGALLIEGDCSLQGNNTSYTGNLQITGGAVTVANQDNIGSGTVLLDGGSITFTSSSAIANPIVVASGGGEIRADSATPVAFSGNISDQDPLNPGTLSVLYEGGGSGTVAFEGTVSFSGVCAIESHTILQLTDDIVGADFHPEWNYTISPSLRSDSL